MYALSPTLPDGDDIVIRVRGLVNRFGKQVIHDHLDLDVRRGEIIGIVGGSGKWRNSRIGTSMFSATVSEEKSAPS